MHMPLFTGKLYHRSHNSYNGRHNRLRPVAAEHHGKSSGQKGKRRQPDLQPFFLFPQCLHLFKRFFQRKFIITKLPGYLIYPVDLLQIRSMTLDPSHNGQRIHRRIIQRGNKSGHHHQYLHRLQI